MNGYILSHDLGTSGNKATLFHNNGTLVGSTLYEYETLYPHDKWVEQDPAVWWQAVCETTHTLLSKTNIKASEVLCVSFSAQMMGCLLVDKSGTPLRNMITWADSRADKQEEEMISLVGLEKGYHITGHRLSASYSAAKLLWVKENEPDIYNKAYKMIHAKDYITYKLTGKILTDYSDGSSTNLLDINTLTWSDDLIHTFGIRKDLLPELHASTDIAGTVTKSAAEQCGLVEGIPVVIGGGDGSCACVGAGVVQEGKAYNVIGTSSWISSASREPYFDPQMRTFNWIHLDKNLYTPCGTMQAAGLSYQWYKNTLCQNEATLAKELGQNVYALLDAMVLDSPPGAKGLVYLPYLIGERSPRWNLQARGAFVGLHASTQKSDMTRAVLEGVGLNLKIILDIFDKAQNIQDIVMIGGGAKGKVWLQILADIWQKPLIVPAYMEEATSMGAAICGGVGIGLYKNFQECAAFNPTKEVIFPNKENHAVYEKLYTLFETTYQQLIPVYQQIEQFNQLP